MNNIVLVVIIILLVVIVVTILSDNLPPMKNNGDTNTYGGYAIQVRPSRISGLGVFATRDIFANEVIEECPCLEDDKNKFGTSLQNYLFRSVNGEKSALPLGYGAIYNHSDKNNANYVFVKAGKDAVKMIITANSPIGKDEEIFVNYGPGYWKNRSHLKK